MGSSSSSTSEDAAVQSHLQNQLVLKDLDSMFPATKHPNSRRTPSFSSSSFSSLSSCSSSIGSCYFPDDNSSPLSPATPLRFSGVPFSWEKLPGIPKKQTPNKKELSLLPLMPPPSTPPTSRRFTFDDIKKGSKQSIHRDPFYAALVECSKDDNDVDEDDNGGSSSGFWSGPKVSRNLSDRFGFISLYTSCKRTCAVSESIIHMPRRNRAASFHLKPRAR